RGLALAPSRAEAAALLARCAEMNARLAEGWRGPDGAPLRFSDDLSDWPEAGSDRPAGPAAGKVRALLLARLAEAEAERREAGIDPARPPRLGPEAGRDAGTAAGEVRRMTQWGELGWRKRVRRRRRLAQAGKLKT
ncbi:MAG: hypothetical protein VX463_07850, partial [Pseudomonadota bacterium]|nr:hypothetical protein [Pseudomonadota bacterium]